MTSWTTSLNEQNTFDNMNECVYQDYYQQLPKNINDTCRFCAKLGTTTDYGCKKIPITKTMANDFHKITQIKLNISDENFTPNMICENCLELLNVSSETITKFQIVDLFWKRYFQLNDSIKLEEFVDITSNVEQDTIIQPTTTTTTTKLSIDGDLVSDIVKAEPLDIFSEDFQIMDFEFSNYNSPQDDFNDEDENESGNNIENENNSANASSDGIQHVKCIFCNVLHKDRVQYSNHIERIHKTERKCKFCQEEFGTAKKLGNHLFKHVRQNGEFKCLECRILFKESGQLQDHKCLSGVVRKTDDYKCSNCKTEFYSDTDFEHHKHCCGNETPTYFNCAECDGQFRLKLSLKNHLKKHIKHSCRYCQKILSNRQILAHEQSHLLTDADSVRCDECKTSYINSERLKAHQKKFHSLNNQFQCSQCPKRFLTEDELNKHIIHARLHEIFFKCFNCLQKFNDISELKKHLCNKFADTGISSNSAAAAAEPDAASTSVLSNFVCLLCQTNFYTEYDMRRHEDVCDRPTPTFFYCNHCKAKYRSKQILCKHYDKEHRRRPCKFCNKILTGRQISIHEQSHSLTEADAAICTICNKRYINLERLQIHNKRAHYQTKEINQFSCKQCVKKFPTETQLRNHMKLHGPKMFNCTDCPKTFVNLAQLRTHTSIHTGKYPFLCDTCGHGLSSKSCLDSHMLRVHNPKKYEQKQKGKPSRRKTDKPRPIKCFKCPLCPLSVGHCVSLRRHLLAYHKFEAEINWDKLKQIICIECNRIFDTAIDKKQHLQEIHKQISCELCVRVFNTDEAYRYHMERHPKNKERPFKCDICGASFIMRKNMAKHKLIVHSSKRDLQCDQCHTAFVTNQELALHVKKVHTDTVVVCQVCNKTFKNLVSLRNHMQLHSGIYRYKCDICNMNFLNSLSYSRHKKRFHSLLMINHSQLINPADNELPT